MLLCFADQLDNIFFPIQFALINFITIFIARYKKWEEDAKALKAKVEEELNQKHALLLEMKRKLKEETKEKRRKEREEREKKRREVLLTAGKAVPMAADEVRWIFWIF